MDGMTSMGARSKRDDAMPRVLMVGPTAPAVGGIATVVEQLLQGPLTQGYRVFSHATNARATPPSHILGSVLRHLGLLLRLVRRIRSHQIDIVHIHTCSGFSFYRSLVDAWMARRFGCKTILHIHGGWFSQFCSKANPLAGWVIGQGLRSADSIVVLGETWRRELETICPDANIIRVPNAVALPDIEPTSEDVLDPGVPTNKPYKFLFLGDISKAKGIDTLLASAAVLKEQGQAFSLTLAGPESDDYAPDSLDQLIAKNGLAREVSYVGVQIGHACRQLLAGCDCLVLPSRAEGLPMSILEAGACGKAVIASKVGAIPELLSDELFGMVIPPSEVQALVNAMERLAGNPQASRAMGENLRRRIGEHFSLDCQANILDGLYREMLAAAPLAPIHHLPMAGGAHA